MKMAGKVDAVREWAKTWPQLDDLLKLNAIRNEDGDASFSPVFGPPTGKPLIDGREVRDFVFTMKMMLPWSDGHDPTNAEAERLMIEWIDWVNEQYPNNVPDWPGAEIDSIEALYNVPAVTTGEEEEMAEYLYQAKITFIE